MFIANLRLKVSTEEKKRRVILLLKNNILLNFLIKLGERYARRPWIDPCREYESW